MTAVTIERSREDLAKLEDAFRALAKEACRDMSMEEGRELKARSGKLIEQMRKTRKACNMPSYGNGWVNEVIRRPQP